MTIGERRHRLLRRRDEGVAEVRPIELFFDLVYVFAIGQLSHHLLEHVDLRTGAETAILTLAVIYAWCMTAWGTNWLEPDRLPVQLYLVGLMFASLLMSVAIADAFDGRAWLFVTGYDHASISKRALRHTHLPPKVYLSFGLDRSEVHAMSADMPDAAQAALTAQSAAEEAMNASLAHSGAAQKAAQDAKQTAQDVKESTSDLVKALDLKVGAPTTVFQPWQQIPAWALGLASVGFAVLLVLAEPQNQEAGWAFAIVGLVLAVLLSFRAEFTFGSVGDEADGEPSAAEAESSGSGGGEPSEGAATDQPVSDG